MTDTFAELDAFSMQTNFPVAPLATGSITMQVEKAVPLCVSENAP
jgi:hypothetical protein